jgi:raffinose/stachyose/melibiose transport system permease protein
MQQEKSNVQTAAPAHVESRPVSRLFSGDGLLNLSGYLVLIAYSFLALYPIAIVIVNSFKNRRGIFRAPYAIPGYDNIEMFGSTVMVPVNWEGYETVLTRANFIRYYSNSFVVTIVMLFLVLWFGSMTAFALSEYRFRGNQLLGLFFALGIMIPIRLGTVSIIRIMQSIARALAALPAWLHGIDPLGIFHFSPLEMLIILYTAWGIPITVFILTEFIRDIPKDLKDAARVDGANEFRIYLQLILPMVRPALATVAVFHMIPVWNDLWWPLVLANTEETRTIMLGVSEFVGQFKTDYAPLLAALTLAMMPILILYAIFSRQLIRGISTGAVKS